MDTNNKVVFIQTEVASNENKKKFDILCIPPMDLMIEEIIHLADPANKIKYRHFLREQPLERLWNILCDFRQDAKKPMTQSRLLREQREKLKESRRQYALRLRRKFKDILPSNVMKDTPKESS